MSKEYLLQQCRSLVPLSTMREQHLITALASSQSIMACSGDILFEESGLVDKLYFLLSGEILLKHQNGSERIITADFHWLPVVQFQTEEFSATAITDCELICFDRHTLDNLLTWSQVADYLEIDISYDRNLDEDADWLQSLLNSNLFYKIPPLNVMSIHSKVSSRIVHKGDVIITQGETGDFCYFIKEGLAEVTRSEDKDSPETSVATISEGRCFGEDALIKHTKRNASVKMLSDGVLMCLHKTDFDDLLEAPKVEMTQFETISSIQENFGENGFEFLDVRTQEEFDYKHIKNSIHIPLPLLRLKIRLLDPQKQYLVYCNTGLRSHAAAFLLAQKGYKVSLLEDGLMGINPQQVANFLVSEYDSIHQMASSGH